MSKIDLIVERLKLAPPEVVEEVLALIELLESEIAAAKPRYGSILRHFGTLKDSKALEGDPLAIQVAMRREWD